LKIPYNLTTVVDAVRAGISRAGDKNWVECAGHVQERVLVPLCIKTAAHDLTAIVYSSEGSDSSFWAIQGRCEHTHIFQIDETMCALCVLEVSNNLATVVYALSADFLCAWIDKSLVFSSFVEKTQSPGIGSLLSELDSRQDRTELLARSAI
jgi:hypothetical protein